MWTWNFEQSQVMQIKSKANHTKPWHIINILLITTIKLNSSSGLERTKHTTNKHTKTQNRSKYFCNFQIFWFFWFFSIYVTIRDHRDSLSAMVGSTLPREWVWYSRYTVTVENENKQINKQQKQFFFSFSIFFIRVTIRDHSDLLSAMVGSTLPRE